MAWIFHIWVFQICWHIKCSILIASSFRVLNSSKAIPLALLTAVLLKAYLTSCNRMTVSGWLTTPSWLLGSLRYFLYSYFVYSFCLFLMSSASSRYLQFLSFIVPIFEWNIPFIYTVLWRRTLVFSFLLFSSVSLHCSLKKVFLSLLAILWNPVFSWVYLSLSPLLFASLLPSAICKASSHNHFAFCASFSLGCIWSLSSVQYYRSPSIVLQAHWLLDLIPWIYPSHPLHIHRGFDLGFTWLA